MPSRTRRTFFLSVVCLVLAAPGWAAATSESLASSAAIGDTIEPVTDTITDTTEPVTDTITDTEPVTDAVDDALAPVEETLDPATDTIGDAVQPVTEVVEPITDTTEPITDTITDTTEPVTDLTKPITDTTDPVTDPVTDTITDTTKPITDTTDPVTDPITDTITDTTEPITDTTAGATKPLADSIRDVTGPTTDAVNDLVQPVTDDVGDAVSPIGEVIDDGGLIPGTRTEAVADPDGRGVGTTEAVDGGNSAPAPDGRRNGFGFGGGAAESRAGGASLPGTLVSATSQAPSPVLGGVRDSEAIHRVLRGIADASRKFSFPLTVAALVLLFLAVQGRLDARDPKLAARPEDEELVFA